MQGFMQGYKEAGNYNKKEKHSKELDEFDEEY